MPKPIHSILPIIIAIALMMIKYPIINDIRMLLNYITSPIYYIIATPSKLYDWAIEKNQNTIELREQLHKLSAENKILKTQLQTRNSDFLELKQLKEILNTTHIIKNKNYTLASIINTIQSSTKKQFIVNKGINNKINPQTIALGSKGIIGKVLYLANNHSTILTIVDPTHYIAVKNQRNGLMAIAQGVAGRQNQLKLNFIQADADIKIDDVFITNGIGGLFPKNHPVGKVKTINRNQNNFLDIRLEPFENINQLEYVLLVNND